MRVFGMAGLAEAAETFGALIVIGALAGFLALLWIGFVKRSKIAILLASCLWIGIGWLLLPWHAFDTPQSPNDPDEAHWMFIYRALCLAWLIAALLNGVVLKKSKTRFGMHGKKSTKPGGL